MKPKLIATLLILLLFAIIVFLLPGMLFGNASLDINFHDTYIILGPWQKYTFYAMLVLLAVLAARSIAGLLYPGSK